MINSRSRALVMSVALVTLFTLLPNQTYAAAPCTMAAARTPEARAELWREAVDNFTAARPDLSAEQSQLLGQAVSLGNEIATLKQDAREQAVFARKATRFMDRARELFTNNELGELFTGMGQTQVWLAELAASTPYCNCTGSGSCTFGGGPTGTCTAGCQSWDGEDGRRRDGLCSSAEEQLE